MSLPEIDATLRNAAPEGKRMMAILPSRRLSHCPGNRPGNHPGNRPGNRKYQASAAVTMRV